MSRADVPITVADIRADFENRLNAALSQGTFYSEALIDSETQDASIEIAKIYPRYDAELIRKAREELELQLDGTHRKRAAEKLAADLRERGVNQ